MCVGTKRGGGSQNCWVLHYISCESLRKSKESPFRILGFKCTKYFWGHFALSHAHPQTKLPCRSHRSQLQWWAVISVTKKYSQSKGDGPLAYHHQSMKRIGLHRASKKNGFIIWQGSHVGADYREALQSCGMPCWVPVALFWDRSWEQWLIFQWLTVQFFFHQMAQHMNQTAPIHCLKLHHTHHPYSIFQVLVPHTLIVSADCTPCTIALIIFLAISPLSMAY